MSLYSEANETIKRNLPDWVTSAVNRKPTMVYNPAREMEGRMEVKEALYTVIDYSTDQFEERQLDHVEDAFAYQDNGHNTWLNIDGIIKADVVKLTEKYGVHMLVIEDILSIGQRAKMDEINDVVFCLLPMLYYNHHSHQVETEQVSIVLGKDFLLSFQEDPERDVFDPIRVKLRSGHEKLRQSNTEYLCYTLLDIIVDSYFGVIQCLSDRIETLEDRLLEQKERNALPKISVLRREVLLLQRSISPVRELIGGFMRSDNELLKERNEKYYKDIHDHIVQAVEYADNHREMLVNLQDLNMSQINMRMNEVMKMFTMVATLLAPATVIGGIFGMNFDVIPLTHQQSGFYLAVFSMLFIPLLMLVWFKRKGWF
jgi:magnesium transporter